MYKHTIQGKSNKKLSLPKFCWIHSHVYLNIMDADILLMKTV